MLLEDDKFNGSLVDKKKKKEKKGNESQQSARSCQSQQTHRHMRSGDGERSLAFAQARRASYMMMRKMMVAATMMAAETSITLCQL